VYERSLSPEHEPHELELVMIEIEPEKKMPKGDVVPQREVYARASKFGSVWLASKKRPGQG
jgi:hypothetical protein